MLQVRARWFYFAIACVSLGIGYVVYFLGRPGPAIYAIPSSIEHWILVQPVVAEISGQLPSFFHTFAFILFLAVVLNPSRAGQPLICLGWMAVELFLSSASTRFSPSI